MCMNENILKKKIWIYRKLKSQYGIRNMGWTFDKTVLSNNFGYETNFNVSDSFFPCLSWVLRREMLYVLLLDLEDGDIYISSTCRGRNIY
jgi:hypothetical protein